MLQRIAGKIFYALSRSGRYVNRHIINRNRVAPYKLKYTIAPDTPKIFHINGNFVIGGTSQLIADIIARTSDKYTHHIIVPGHPYPLPYQPLPISEFPLSKMSELYALLKKEQPAIVHIHYWIRPHHSYYDFGIWYSTAFKMCEALSLKVIQNINVPTEPYKSSAIVHNVFVSAYVRNEYNGLNATTSSVIHPGSDFSHFTGVEDFTFSGNTIGMVYRLDKDKLNEQAIEIFINVVKQKPDIRCYIIGGGYFLKYYKQRVKEEGMGKHFIFTGFVSYQSLPNYYKKIGLIVAPVHDESFGQVTPFAMSMGLPVAGYDIGALCEILGSRETLVNYGDVNSLSELIVDLMNNPEQRNQLGIKNKNRARTLFSVEKMIEQYELLYQTISQRKSL